MRTALTALLLILGLGLNAQDLDEDLLLGVDDDPQPAVQGSADDSNDMAEEESDSVGTVYAIKGDLTVFPEDDPAARSGLVKYQAVDAGVVLETGSDASAVIQLKGSLGFVHMDRNTRLKIDYYYSVKRDAHTVRLNLSAGKIRTVCYPLETIFSSFTVITPNGAIGTAGGDLVVAYSSKKGLSYLLNYMGTAAVKHMTENLKSVNKAFVKAGQFVAIYDKDGVSKAKEAESGKLDKDFWNEYEVALPDLGGIDWQEKQIRKEMGTVARGTSWSSPLSLAR